MTRAEGQAEETKALTHDVKKVLSLELAVYGTL